MTDIGLDTNLNCWDGGGGNEMFASFHCNDNSDEGKSKTRVPRKLMIVSETDLKKLKML